MLAVALGCLLLFSVLAFATTEQWSLSTFQVGTFLLGIWCAGRRSLRWHPLGFALAGVVALAAIQLWVGATVYRFATANALVNWTAYFVLFIVSLEALADSEIRRNFLRGLLYVGFAIAVLSTVQYFTSDGAVYWVFHVSSGRPFGPFVNPDHYAAFIELILPLAIYEARRDRSKLWLHTAMVGALYASVIASASRAGAALATLEIPCTAVARTKIRLRRQGYHFVSRVCWNSQPGGGSGCYLETVSGQRSIPVSARDRGFDGANDSAASMARIRIGDLRGRLSGVRFF